MQQVYVLITARTEGALPRWGLLPTLLLEERANSVLLQTDLSGLPEAQVLSAVGDNHDVWCAAYRGILLARLASR